MDGSLCNNFRTKHLFNKQFKYLNDFYLYKKKICFKKNHTTMLNERS